MRLEPIAALAVLLAMSACGSGEKKDQAKGEQAGSASATASAASTSAASLGLNPGEWETTVETLSMNAPGMPPEIAAKMKGSKISTRSCMTPEEAKRPTAETFGKLKGDCKASEFSATGGKLHAVITCGSSAGGKAGTTMTTDGSFGGDAFDMQTKMVTDTERGQMSAESHTTGRRVGECTKAAG